MSDENEAIDDEAVAAEWEVQMAADAGEEEGGVDDDDAMAAEWAAMADGEEGEDDGGSTQSTRVLD